MLLLGGHGNPNTKPNCCNGGACAQPGKGNRGGGRNRHTPGENIDPNRAVLQISELVREVCTGGSKFCGQAGAAVTRPAPPSR